MLNAKLVVVGGDAFQDEIQLSLPVVIGRGVDVDLALSDELISRKHAEIYEKEGQLFVRDLGSRNGTFVNNRKIQGDSPLDPEELLTLGTITFRAIYERLLPANDVAAQFKDTVRVNFDKTETLGVRLHPSNLVGTNSGGIEDRETVDLDEVKKDSAQGLPPDPPRKTAYVKDRWHQPEPFVPTETLTMPEPLLEAAEPVLIEINRRRPK